LCPPPPRNQGQEDDDGTPFKAVFYKAVYIPLASLLLSFSEADLRLEYKPAKLSS